LSNNSLSGTIPSSIGELRKLNSLKPNNNYLERPLPSPIDDLIKLEYLYLHNNTLNETIPSTIGKLFNLKELNLSNNNLSSIISTREIEDLSALEYFNLRNNHKWEKYLILPISVMLNYITITKLAYVIQKMMLLP